MATEYPIVDGSDFASITDADDNTVLVSAISNAAGVPINPATAEGIASVVAGISTLASEIEELTLALSEDEPSYPLANVADIALNGNTTPVTNVQSAAYIWGITAGDWDGSTITLQALGPDGTTWLTVETATADGQEGVTVGNNASLRLRATVGAPTGVSSSLT